MPNIVRLDVQKMALYAKSPADNNGMPVQMHDLRILCRPSIRQSSVHEQNGGLIIDMHDVTMQPLSEAVGLSFDIYTLQKMKSAVALHTLAQLELDGPGEHNIDVSVNYDTKRPILVGRSVVDGRLINRRTHLTPMRRPRLATGLQIVARLIHRDQSQKSARCDTITHLFDGSTRNIERMDKSGGWR